MEEVRQFHLALAYCVLFMWIPVMRFAVAFAIRPRSNMNSAIRHLRSKVIGIAIAIGVIFPVLLVMAYISCDSIYESPLDRSLLTAVILTFLINGYCLYCEIRKKPLIGNLKVVSYVGYMFPAIEIITVIIDVFIRGILI